MMVTYGTYRQDAITPIVGSKYKNLHLLKDAGETHLDDKFCLNVLSVFDEDNWVKPTDPDKINIGLYHGAIKYSRTDIGFVMEHGEHSISILMIVTMLCLGISIKLKS